MDRTEFGALLRDLLFNLHDIAVLEKHRANAVFPRPDPGASRSDNLRRVVREGIETLRPREGGEDADALAWRYYRILHGRYIEGESIADLQKRLALGERQERRLHGRALSALENILWDRYLAPGAATVEGMPTAAAVEEPGGESEAVSYQPSLEPLRLDRIIREVAQLCQPRIEARGGGLELHINDSLPQALTDRVILRQIMLDLVSRILQTWVAPEIAVCAVPRGGEVIIAVDVRSDSLPSAGGSGQPPTAVLKGSGDLGSTDLLPQGPLLYWVDRLNAGLTVEYGNEERGAQARFLLALPRANQSTILVVDDHEQAIRIIQRYLNQTNIQVVGTTDPAQVIVLARAIHPQAVLLDIMMPTIDGWELLQALKSDPETKDILVIICSVWEQPDLAFSLGANGFLKKPISQVDLLSELARSNLLDNADGSLPAGS